ncbi:hypothetical protein [Mesorhizobium sp. Root172]|nr:hypothetical protein [Mesorhizobium sp. Root172]
MIEEQLGSAAGREATIAGWDDRQQLKAIVDGLDAADTVSVAFDAVKLVA